MDYPRYGTEDLSRAAGVPKATVSSWIGRLGSSMIEPDDDAPDRVFGGTGRARMFKWKTVIRIAIMARLARVGVSIELAHLAAMTFVDVGEGGAGYGQEPIAMSRLPGEFFPNREGTYLRIDFLDEAEPRVQVVRERDTSTQNTSAVVLIVDLERLVTATDQRLRA